MTEKVLFVDDDTNLLKIYARALPERIDAAGVSSGRAALEKVASDGPYALVVSDMQMPGMNGIDLLKQLKERAPDTVRIMLTGLSDQTTAMQAVNQGEVFRFLTKPPQRQALIDAVDAGIRQHQLIRAEQELLQDTLKGSVAALAHVLSLADPRIFGRTTRITELMRACTRELGVADDWQYETSALLSQVGCITLPDSIIEKVFTNQPLTAQEATAYARYPAASAELVDKIPRMEPVSECIRYQLKGFDGSGHPEGKRHGKDIPLGGRLLRVIHDFLQLSVPDNTAERILTKMRAVAHVYDPDVLQALTSVHQREVSATEKEVREIPIGQLTTDMIIAEDVHLKTGAVLVCSGQAVSKTLLDRLSNFAASGAIESVLRVQASEA